MPGFLAEWTTRARRWVRGRPFTLWYDPAYRLPFASLEASTGIDPRRADMVVSYLLGAGFLLAPDVRAPSRIRYEDLARVHSAELLESLQDPVVLGNVFAVDPSDVVVEEVLHTIRLACGGTLDATREALLSRSPTLNLLGGFHHAGPNKGGGFCIVNDIAVAVAAVRAEGYTKRVAVLDLDAHPPDGTAACFAGDPAVWIGSLSGADWGKLEGVDETVLPKDCDDGSYLSALAALLSRMPPAGLAFVLAGGDVLAHDRFGALALSLDGVRRRDLAVHHALAGVPAVWLPGGGYTVDAWRALAGTGMVLARASRTPIPAAADPLGAMFSKVARELTRDQLEGPFWITEADLFGDLDRRSRGSPRFLGYYTTEGIEYAFSRYGLLQQLRRLGYGAFRVAVDRDERGDRFRLFAEADGVEHLLIECVLERRKVADEDVLYVHWLTLRHPRGRFSEKRPRLPGQEEPGLGLSREAGQLFLRVAERLGLAGVAFRPAWLHTAYAARFAMVFVDAIHQAHFEALLEQLAQVRLAELSQAIADGRVTLDGERYTWEAGEMVYWLDQRSPARELVEREKQRARFALTPTPARAAAT
ncbi:MAG: histone deacetylase [Myxococcales bacterium]|nr:histone deacetylase [Myxococcales bacterium]